MIEDGNPLHPTAIRFGTTSNTGVANPAVIWFALFCDGWDALITQITTAVGFRDRALQKTMLTNDSILEVDQSRSTPDPSQCRSRSDDAFVSYYRSLDTMDRFYRNRIGAYNYKTFETKYALVWGPTAPILLDPAPLNPALTPEQKSHFRALASTLPQTDPRVAALRALLGASTPSRETTQEDREDD
jgi:hypothetical protein